MQSNVRKMMQIAAMLFLVLGVADSARAQFAGGSPWQVGDIVVCFGNGTCNVMRNTSINGLVLLDQISDAGQSFTPGATNGTAINNTLHLFTTDAGTPGGSNIVEYSIASVNPFTGLPVAHTPVQVFDGSVANGSAGIQAIALDAHGNIFVGNNNPSTIVELSQSGALLNSFVIPQATTPAWQPSFQYFTIGAKILDPNGHLQIVATPGTSGNLYPPFNQFGGTALDNAVVWTDQGQKVWRAKTSYALNAVIIDPASHLQQVVTAGTSGNNQPSPWNDSGGTTKDSSVVWQDRGLIAWQTNHSYAVGQFAAGPAGASAHLQQVTRAGTSGPAQPNWNTSGGTTPDGLQWTDTGSAVGTGCVENQLNSLDLDSTASAVYFTSGPGIIQKVTGLSSCKVFADFGPNVTLHGIRVLPAGSLSQVGTCKGAACPTGEAVLVVATGTQFVDSDNDLPGSGAGADPTEFSSGQEIVDVCTGATLTAAPAPPGPPPPSDSCALLLDVGTGAIVARYPITNVNTLQALTVDPLVTDCSASGSCSSIPLPPASVSNFWLGDSATANFYKVDFASGNAITTFNANFNCTGCSPVTGIQALGIYGGEGANQPDLTKLFSGSLTSTANTAVVQFPLPGKFGVSPDTNQLTVTLYGQTSTTPPTPLALYASLIDESTCFTDQTPSLPCTPTTSDPTKGIVWKVDIPLANNSTGATALPFAETMAGDILAPTGITFSTDVAIDAFYDTTTSVNIVFKPPSTAMPYNVVNANGEAEVDAGCTYANPLAPSLTLPPQCLGSNPNNITFKFSCSNFPGPIGSYAGGHPNLIIVRAPFPLPLQAPAPNSLCAGNTLDPCVLSGTGGTTNWRFGQGKWVFNWNVAGQGTYRACTYDRTNVDLPFCTNFIVPGAAKCPK